MPSTSPSDSHDDHNAPRRVWGATLLQALGRLWGAGCTLTLLWLAADALPLAGFGRFTFYLAAFAWLDSLANMGTGQVAVQWTAAARERTADVLATARRVRLAAGGLGLALVAGTAFAWDEPDAGWIVLAALYPITHALELSATVFQNRIAWGVPVAVRAAASGLSLAGVALLHARGEARPALYLVAVAAGSTLGNLLLHAASRGFLARDRRGVARPVALGSFLRTALPLGLAGLCAQTYFYVDNLFIRALEGDTALGHYNVAVRFMSWSIMLAQYVTHTALPWLTRRHQAGQLGAAIDRLGPPLFALAGLATGLLAPWSELLLSIFGPEFTAAGASLRWLFAAAAVIYAGALFATAVVATGNMLPMLWIAAGGVLLNVAGNALAVPAMGIEGAALVTFLTELFVALSAAWVLARSGAGPSAARAWSWAAGPLLFGLGWWLASLLGASS